MIVFLLVYGIWVSISIGLVAQYLRLCAGIHRDQLGYWRGRYAWLFFRTDAALQQIGHDIQERGRVAGFRPLHFTVVGIRSWIIPTQAQAIVNLPEGVAFIWRITPRGRMLSQQDMAILLAHEYGHMLDYITHRRGHSALEQLSGLDEEDFANAIASYLYSPEQQRRTYARHHLTFDVGRSRRREFTRPH